MSFIEKVTAERRAEAQRRREQGAMEAAERALAERPVVRDFESALHAPGLSLIAEIKRASPAKGDIAIDADAVAIAKSYEAGGAAAISVLTEPTYFKGSLDDLSSVRGVIDLPVLRKDFVCDTLHVKEAAAAGADAVLLIVAALTQTELVTLIDACALLGIAADVEVHDAAEVPRAVDAGARIIAINARNLATLEVDLATIERLRPMVPDGIPVVAESGISTRDDVVRMEHAGVDAIHIGETLMRAAEPAKRIQELLGR
jgi:indole-3-glycerol phosphate synthase